MEDINYVDNLFITESDLLDYVDNVSDPEDHEPETIKEEIADSVINTLST